MSIRHIHTQAQAQAELGRQRAAQRASYTRRKERMLNSTPAQAQAELQRQRAVRTASCAQWKERMLNDAEYREQELQRWKAKRDQKRKAIEEDPLHVNKRQDADRMAKVRRVVRETQNALDAQDREGMIEKVRQRYIFSHTIAYIENLGARHSVCRSASQGAAMAFTWTRRHAYVQKISYIYLQTRSKHHLCLLRLYFSRHYGIRNTVCGT